ncbi:hypothetical protein NHX12_013685 [Muraenolepis orangiensis]|uniref:G-protein coupled receptors family 1 profile domain-containing protein n=1 Tax=Muraenolepis orangiensis TaxID=630683 RepID=A0A9Q0DB23_9TELE|nr:hypothetical protein NHX12_013685 [Muraenolepis orangiensis]
MASVLNASVSLLYPTSYSSSSLSPFSLDLTLHSTSFPSSSTPPLTPAPQRTTAQIGVAILSLAFLLGFPGNLFVVWSVLWRVKLRSVTCLLVLHLAAADALVLLSAPFFLRYLTSGRGWEFGGVVCKLVHYLSSVNMYVSIYLITLMSADRCLAVRVPFLSHRLRTKRVLLAVLLGKLHPITNVTLYLCTQQHWDSVPHQVFQYVFETVMSFAVPFSFIVGCYAAVIQRLRSAVFQKKGRGNRLILAIVAAFGLFWLPYHIINVIEVYGLLQGNAVAVRAARQGRPSVTAFAYFSSAVNPILYVFTGSSHIRRAGLGFMGKLFEATNSEARTTIGSSSASRTRSSRGLSTAMAAESESSPLRVLSGKLGRPFRKASGDEEVGAGAGDREGRFRSEVDTA